MINPLYMEDIEELMNDEKAKERFQVDNLGSATWAMRMIRAAKEKQAEIQAVADDEMARIVDWFKRENKKHDQTIEFFTGLLQEYHFSEIAKDPKKKTITTPHGNLQMRKSQPKWIYDEERLLPWLKQNGYAGYIRVKEEPNKAELKKVLRVADDHAFDENGQPVDGITVIEQPDSFGVMIE